MATVATDRSVLAYDPWAGDRDSDARTLRDKMVITRRPAQCVICWDDIPVGARVRAQTQVSRDEGRTMTFRFCPACCVAMASSWDDNGEDIEQRTQIGITRARALGQS
jgi:hypothetical protein